MITFVNLRFRDPMRSVQLNSDVIEFSGDSLSNDTEQACKVPWLSKLFSKRSMWVRRLIINEMKCYHIRTTQRVESINSRIDSITTRHESLCGLAESIRSKIDDVQIVKYNERELADEKSNTGFMTSFCSVESILVANLTSYAYKKEGSELNLCVGYTLADEITDNLQEGGTITRLSVCRDYDTEEPRQTDNADVHLNNELTSFNWTRCNKEEWRGENSGLVLLMCHAPIFRSDMPSCI